MDRSPHPEVTDVEHGGLQGRLYASKLPGGDRDDGVPAFVLVHGIGVSHRSLARLHQALAQSADTYSIDLPGFGGTPKPKKQLSVEEYTAFIIAVLDEAGVEKNCVFIGHSMGAQFAVEAAILDPARFSHVVLMGPVVDPERRNAALQAWDLFRDSVGSESLSSNWIVFTDYIKCGLRWYLKELPAMMDYVIEERVLEVKAPVLVVRGSRDPVAQGDWCRRLAARSAGKLAEIPGCGHVVQHLATGKVADVIRAFVGLPAAAARENLR